MYIAVEIHPSQKVWQLGKHWQNAGYDLWVTHRPPTNILKMGSSIPPQVTPFGKVINWKESSQTEWERESHAIDQLSRSKSFLSALSSYIEKVKT